MSDKIRKSEAEWQAELSPEAYRVMREYGTERPFASPLNTEKRQGKFVCAGCGKELFASGQKFDSGTGWPSFTAPVSAAALGTQEDRSHFMRRIEVHCDSCGAHLGHVFPDGPQEAGGLRYCINGCALEFKPEKN